MSKYEIKRRLSQSNYNLKMKSNNNLPSEKMALNTPNTFVSGSRARLFSFNTPHLSPLPLRMIQSPFPLLGDGSLFENQLNLGGQFKLEQGPAQEHVEQVKQSSEESGEQIQFPKFPKDVKITKDNMIEFLIDAINTNEERISEVKQSFEESGPPFLSEIFTYLQKRFKKLKKTKEEMIKYTIRKSFKYITDQLKKEDPSLIPLLTTDGLEGMSIYFQKHCQDEDISIPFKKNSLEKTMNANFLRKVFAVYRFYKDYKKFLKTFQSQFLKDNKKKIVSMNQAVKQCLATKSFKALQNFKRLPWTKDILYKLKEFSAELLSYSPYSRERTQMPMYQQQQKYPVKMDLSVQAQKPAPKRSIDSLNFDDLVHNNNFDEEKEQSNILEQAKPSKKKSVIILTPVAQTLNSPKIPDLGFSLE